MSNSSDERSPRFSRAILGRIVAVLAFVGLGTFAVVQSVTGSKGPNDEVAQNGSETEQVESLQHEPETGHASIQTDLSTPPAKKLSFGDLSKNEFNPPKPKSFDTSGFGKPAANPFPKKTSGGAASTGLAANTRFSANAQSPSSAPPSRSSLEPNKSATGPPIVVAKQATTAPPPASRRFSDQFATQNRSSQSTTTTTPPPTLRPTQRPSDNSFGARTGSMPNSLNDSINSSIKNAAKKTKDIAEDLRGTTQQALGNSFQKAQNGFESINKAAKSGLPKPNTSSRSSFNSNPVPKQPTSVVEQRSSASQPSANPNASFDTSANLQPFGSTAKQESTSSFGDSNSPRSKTFPANPVTQNPATQRRTTPPSSPPARQPFTQIKSSSTVSNSSPLNTAANPRPMGTPGDRQLEGVQAPSLTIEKIAPREIQVNQPADFQIVVRNSGRVTANDVQVFDAIPTGTEYVAAVPQPTRSGAQELRWDLGEMRPGQEKRIKVQLKPVRPGEIGSVAHVTFASQASMRTLVTKPVLEIRHSAQPKVLIGDNVVFDVTVENKGDGPANQVILQEDIPAQLEFSDGSRELEYEIGTLAPGQSKQIRLALRAVEIGRLKNVMVAEADGGLIAQHAIDMEVIAPQLVASGTGPKRKYLKREAIHQFSVENKGTADATNVELIARLPSGLKFMGANNRGKYDPNTHAVYWSLAELTPGIVGTVDVTTLPIESGEQKISFEAVADLNQKSQAEQNLMVEHLIDVFFDIDDVVDPIEIGSPTSYRIRLQNQGTKTATNVIIQIDFPNGLQPVSVDGNLTNEIRGQQILFDPITSMNPGDEIKLVVNAKGVSQGDHRVVVRLQTDGRTTPVSKEETTRVYDDQ